VSTEDLSPEERKMLETKCRRRVIENLHEAGRKIGPRTRMIDVIVNRGVVDGLRSMKNEETSGWNALYAGDCIHLSVEATIVESLEFRRLFTAGEIEQMERDLREVEYEPKPPA
jgi:hypothetical protein